MFAAVTVWLIGFQLALEKNAAKAIGIYVNIKIGNVTVNSIFLGMVVCILFHSVTVVIAPIMRNVRYIFPIKLPM